LVFMPPLNLVTVPIFFFVAAAFIGYVSEKQSEVPSCPRCRRDLPNASAATKLARSAAGPTNERFVEGALIGKA
jgi:hypothetical protein